MNQSSKCNQHTSPRVSASTCSNQMEKYGFTVMEGIETGLSALPCDSETSVVVLVTEKKKQHKKKNKQWISLISNQSIRFLFQYGG